MSQGTFGRQSGKGGISIAQVVLLLALPLLVYLAFSAGRKVIEMVVMRQQASELRQEIDELKVRNGELRDQITYLKSDEYVERVARDELGLIKPGDTPVVVVVPTPAPTPAATPTPTPQPPIWRRAIDQVNRLLP